jgi:hypothetical protein
VEPSAGQGVGDGVRVGVWVGVGVRVGVGVCVGVGSRVEVGESVVVEVGDRVGRGDDAIGAQLTRSPTAIQRARSFLRCRSGTFILDAR